MFEIVVVVLEGGAGVVGRVDIDALHLTGVERQQCLERFEVVALDEHVAGARIASRKLRRFFEQPIGHAPGGADIVVAGEPVQNGHAGGRLSGKRQRNLAPPMESSADLPKHCYCIRRRRITLIRSGLVRAHPGTVCTPILASAVAFCRAFAGSHTPIAKKDLWPPPVARGFIPPHRWSRPEPAWCG